MNTKVSRNKAWALLKIGVVANVLECYEFSVYAFLAPIIGQVLLKANDPVTQLIQSYVLFTVTYLARPFGSVLFGYIADHKSRSDSLKLSLILMSIPTALIGILPTYNQIGYLATISFLLLRFIQGFSVGGEVGINACYIYETAPKEHRSFLCSTVNASSTIGVLSGSCMAAFLFYWFDQHIILQWAWRLPYLLGVPITLWIGLVRNTIRDTHAVVQNRSASDLGGNNVLSSKLPSVSQLLPVVILGGFMQVCSYTLFIWMPNYLVYFLQIEPAIAQFYNTIGLVIWIGFILLSGYLSDIVGYKPIAIIHILAILVLVSPVYLGLQYTTPKMLLGIYLLLAWLQSGLPAVLMQILGDAFPAKVRGMGMSLGHTLPATFLGGTVPLVCTYMIHKTGWVLFPAFYIIGMGVIALPFALRLKPRK